MTIAWSATTVFPDIAKNVPDHSILGGRELERQRPSKLFQQRRPWVEEQTFFFHLDGPLSGGECDLQ
jgi:hypothetical protein